MGYGRGGSQQGGGRYGQPYQPYGGGYGPGPGYGPYGPPYPPPGAAPGYGYWPYPPPPPPDQELQMLRDQAQYLEQALQDIRKRITELEAEAGQQ